MHSGGTGQFSAIVYSFVGAWVTRKQQEIFGDIEGDPTDPKAIQQLKEAVDNDLKIDYLITVGWSQKAAAEGERLFGPEHVNIAADSRKTNGGKFGTIPDEGTWKLSKDAALVYFCSNETVHGIEFLGFPKSLEPGPDRGGPIVANMSSNILSRKIPIHNFSAIFFGAQKHLGVASITVVVIKKSFLPQPSAALMRQLALLVSPRILEFDTIAKSLVEGQHLGKPGIVARI